MILNLSLYDENNEVIVFADTIKLLFRVLSTTTTIAKENTTCTLLQLSQVKENRTTIGQVDVIPWLRSLLASDRFHTKKGTLTIKVPNNRWEFSIYYFALFVELDVSMNTCLLSECIFGSLYYGKELKICYNYFPLLWRLGYAWILTTAIDFQNHLIDSNTCA